MILKLRIFLSLNRMNVADTNDDVGNDNTQVASHVYNNKEDGINDHS